MRMRAVQDDDALLSLLLSLRQTFAQVAVEIVLVCAAEDDPAFSSAGSDQAGELHESRVRRISLRSRQLATSAFAIRVLRWHQDNEHSGNLSAPIHFGLARARGAYITIVDADRSFSPFHVLRLYQAATIHHADIVSGTGADDSGGAGRGQSWTARKHLIRRQGLTWTTKLLFPEQLWQVTDPLSGLFLFRRALLDGSTLPFVGCASALLDVLIQCPWTSLVEVPATGHPLDVYDARTGYVRTAHHVAARSVLRHCGELLRSVPAAGRGWKHALFWLLGVLLSLAPFCLLLTFLQPLWLAWLAAIETLLVATTLGEELNERHALHVGATARRWVASHLHRWVPIGVHAGSLLFLTHLAASPPAALVIATGVSLVTDMLLSPAAFYRRIVVSNAASTVDETMLIGREDRNGNPTISLVVGSALVAGVAAIALAQLGPVVALLALALGTVFLLQYRIDRDKAITVVLALVTAIASVDYAVWRLLMTNWDAWFIAVPLLLAESLGMAHTLGMQWTLWPRKAPRVRHVENPTRRPIFVFIPTVNEGIAVLEPTVRAVQRARATFLKTYPHGQVQIVLCNDGLVAHAPNWREPELLAQRLGITCITRATGGGAKAGNIEHARQQVGATGDALVVIFDADQVAQPEFLLRTVTPFADPSIGWVQTPQSYANTDNPVARWANDQQALFYGLLCPGKAALNAAFICGTNVMLRAAALDEIGGLPQNSVTEDFAASIQLHARWRSIYLPEPLAHGLGPMDLAAYFKQQRRWAIGTLSMLRAQWRAILIPRTPGLRRAQQAQYALACTHYLSGIRDLIYIIAPLLYVAFGFAAVKGAKLDTFLWHFLPYWCASMSAFIYAAWKKTGWRGVVIGFASFPVLVGALLDVLFQRDATFTVTSKRRASRASFSVMAPHTLAFGACLTALLWNWHTHNVLEGTAFFVQLWLLYITIMLTLSLWLAVHDLISQKTWWHELQRFVQRVRQSASGMPVRVGTLLPPPSMLRPALAATICVVALSTSSSAYTSSQQRRMTVTTPMSQIAKRGPYLGIAGDTSVLTSDMSMLAARAHLHFGIVGRTQNVTEPFDVAWATQLSAQDTYPWITLQFGHYEAGGSPSLDASVMAIANGVHDRDLQRLAQSIRDFGQPVLITLLPNVDRDWSLSSAVANGGIPADSARAWMHVHALFQQAKARNVVWVWAPKDPAHDDAFVPPGALYDVVLVNVTYNPAGLSDDPVIIADVAAHHPDKPVLVELTTVHADQGETRWLQQMTNVVSNNHAITGLMYFDGVPGEQQQRATSSRHGVDMRLLDWSRQALSTMSRAGTLSYKATPPFQTHE